MGGQRSMLLVMALLAAQTQDASVAVKATPRGDFPLITNDDYPLSEARQRHEGTVGVLLSIDASGRVAKCDVTNSSGYAGLDNATCVLMMRRGRFNPARDPSGAPVASALPIHFTWRLGNSVPAHVATEGAVGLGASGAPGRLDLTVVSLPVAYRQPVKALVHFGADHSVTKCEVEESSGSAGVDRAACAELRLAAAPSPGHGQTEADTAEYIVFFQAAAPAKP